MIPELAAFNKVPAVARYLTVGVRTLYRLIEDGRIGYIRMGTGEGSIRIRREDVTAFLAANTHPAIQPSNDTTAEGDATPAHERRYEGI